MVGYSRAGPWARWLGLLRLGRGGKARRHSGAGRGQLRRAAVVDLGVDLGRDCCPKRVTVGGGGVDHFWGRYGRARQYTK